VLELGGVRDVLTKSIGTQNPINLVKATMDGLIRLRRPEEVAELRGLTVSQVLGVSSNGAQDGEHLSAAPSEAPAEGAGAPAETPAAEPKAEEPKAEEPKAEEPKVEEES
jgi:small subunit ribosomal protein S5